MKIDISKTKDVFAAYSQLDFSDIKKDIEIQRLNMRLMFLSEKY